MRILIEGYRYPAELVRPILHSIQPLSNLEGKIASNCVGYCYNATSDVQDCVFILPKVILKDVSEIIDGKVVVREKVFGHCDPEKIINIEENLNLPEDDPNHLTDGEVKFIYELSVWIYRSIVVFRDNAKDTSIVMQQQGAPIKRGCKKLSNTFLDIVLGLVQFNNDNQDFIFFVLRNIHSGFDRINWTRTITHSPVFFQNDTPIYINPVNKRNQVNFDEELLIVFYSILQYIHRQYGFPVKINVNFSLLTEEQFQLYLDGYGATRLKQIRYKYYSDKAIELWDLCYAFFERSTQVNIEIDQQDYLLVQNFNIVFEAIIDKLVGDTDNMPAELVEQNDGKIVDHMYTYHSLVHLDNGNNNKNDEVYYIGDSKYYKIDNPIGKMSVAKQFTYARNVIQWNISLFLDGKNVGDDIKLRDDELESYNVIPNFFISGILNKDLDYYDDLVTPTSKSRIIFTSSQFLGRLFDRDTLLISHYDVNFLYVVSLYARNNEIEIEDWKKRVHDKFCKEIRGVLDQHYQFYCMVAKEGVNPCNFLKENFKDIIGRVFTPYPDIDGHRFYSFAMERPESIPLDEENREEKIRLIRDGNDKAEKVLRKGFILQPCKLGEDKRLDMLPNYKSSTDECCSIEDYVFVVKYGEREDKLQNYVEYLKKENVFYKFAVGIGAFTSGCQFVGELLSARFLLLHNMTCYQLYKLKGNPQLVTQKNVQCYPRVGNDSEIYLLFDIDDNVTDDFESIDIEQIIKYNNAFDSKVIRMEDLIV